MINSLGPGLFVDETSNYHAAPQVNVQGMMTGHAPFVVQAIDSFESTKPLDADIFAFFSGVNTPAGPDGTVLGAH